MLQSPEAYNAVMSPGCSVGDVKIPVVQVTKAGDMETELQKVERVNESSADKLNEFKVSLKNSDTKLEEEQLKILVLVKEFKKMEREGKILSFERDMLH